ncbi:hypothetical protein AACH06_10895 [Ideonella sp. DXS29W]|uniref:DUF2946 domain-containing protein n=1 Tax=Ideonella lacteola TaxID=2984193 RepID=A0ABU9BRP9_9BURK
MRAQPATLTLRSRSLRWLLSLTLWAMLASQGLALLHEVAHGEAEGLAPRAGGHGTAVAAAADNTWGRHVLEASASHDPGSALCRLMHQLAHATASTASPVAVFVPPGTPTPSAPLTEGHALAELAAYQARAPPLKA